MKFLESGPIFTCGARLTEDSTQKIHVSKVLKLKNTKYGHVAFENTKNFYQTPSEQKVMMQNIFDFFLVKTKSKLEIKREHPLSSEIGTIEGQG